jgi:hypothetical protein
MNVAVEHIQCGSSPQFNTVAIYMGCNTVFGCNVTLTYTVTIDMTTWSSFSGLLNNCAGQCNQGIRGTISGGALHIDLVSLGFGIVPDLVTSTFDGTFANAISIP